MFACAVRRKSANYNRTNFDSGRMCMIIKLQAGMDPSRRRVIFTRRHSRSLVPAFRVGGAACRVCRSAEGQALRGNSFQRIGFGVCTGYIEDATSWGADPWPLTISEHYRPGRMPNARQSSRDNLAYTSNVPTRKCCRMSHSILRNDAFWAFRIEARGHKLNRKSNVDIEIDYRSASFVIIQKDLSIMPMHLYQTPAVYKQYWSSVFATLGECASFAPLQLDWLETDALLS